MMMTVNTDDYSNLITLVLNEACIYTWHVHVHM